ncbi:MAG TPA: hypothetical protein VGH02_08835 [Rhizomicrobium sp.]|jgi:hypothetical protein
MRNLLFGIATAVLMSAAPVATGAAQPMANFNAASVNDGVYHPGIDPATASPVQLFVYLGRHYCWYDAGWHGPGWYWCGYGWRRGYGWGGGYGWRGWHRGGYHRGYYRGGHYYHPGYRSGVHVRVNINSGHHSRWHSGRHRDYRSDRRHHH